MKRFINGRYIPLNWFKENTGKESIFEIPKSWGFGKKYAFNREDFLQVLEKQSKVMDKELFLSDLIQAEKVYNRSGRTFFVISTQNFNKPNEKELILLNPQKWGNREIYTGDMIKTFPSMPTNEAVESAIEEELQFL